MDDVTVPYVTYNAFTRSTGEAGNPAAVVLLSPSAITVEAEHPSGSVDWRWNGSERFMPDVAAKINLPMTAFLVPQESPGHYLLRWFDPVNEMPLCGHATIALSTYIFSERPDLEELQLRTKVHGTVVARKSADPLSPGTSDDPLVSIDFPELGGLVQIESTLGSRQKWVQIMNDIEAASSGSTFRREDVLEVWQSDQYLLLEFDEGVDIGKIQVDCKTLASLCGHPLDLRADETQGGFAPRKVLLTQVAPPPDGADEQAWRQVPHLFTRYLGTLPGFEVEDSAVNTAQALSILNYG